jgi:hypothetical protein
VFFCTIYGRSDRWVVFEEILFCFLRFLKVIFTRKIRLLAMDYNFFSSRFIFQIAILFSTILIMILSNLVSIILFLIFRLIYFELFVVAEWLVVHANFDFENLDKPRNSSTIKNFAFH